MDPDDMREMFLLFAIKRKIKLMSFLINDANFNMDFRESHFLDVLENSAYDMAALLLREYFLKLNDEAEKTINLLVNSFSETNGMLESKSYILKRYITKMTYEQATSFLDAVEKGVKNTSRGNILILSLNVIKSACLLIELLEKVREQYTFLERRIEEIKNAIIVIA